MPFVRLFAIIVRCFIGIISGTQTSHCHSFKIFALILHFLLASHIFAVVLFKCHRIIFRNVLVICTAVDSISSIRHADCVSSLPSSWSGTLTAFCHYFRLGLAR